MIILLIVILSSIAWLGVGIAATAYTVPRGIYRSYMSLSHNDTEADHLKRISRECALGAGRAWRWFTIFLWPVAVALTLARDAARLLRPIETYAPWYKDAQIEQQQRRLAVGEREIAKLERELGIGDKR